MRRSKFYMFTAHVMSASDMIRIGELQRLIANSNRFSNQKQRVVLRGRKAIEKVDNQSYDQFGNIVGGLANASQIDVYVYKR